MQIARAGVAFSLFSLAALVACDSHPGGTVGPPCSDVGGNDEACLDDEICDVIEDGDAYCLRRCGSHDDCDVEERCNGTTGNNEKTCHPTGIDDGELEGDCEKGDPDYPDCK